MYRERTISAWQREEDGSYKADIDGFHLHVTWRPESPDARRGFAWTVEGPDAMPAEKRRFESDDVVEEIEEAMGNAEYELRMHLHPELV